MGKAPAGSWPETPVDGRRTMTDHDVVSDDPASAGTAYDSGAWPSSPPVERPAPLNDYDWGLSFMAPVDVAPRATVGRLSGTAAAGTALALVGLGGVLTGLLAPEGLVVAFFGGVLS